MDHDAIVDVLLRIWQGNKLPTHLLAKTCEGDNQTNNISMLQSLPGASTRQAKLSGPPARTHLISQPFPKVPISPSVQLRMELLGQAFESQTLFISANAMARIGFLGLNYSPLLIMPGSLHSC